MMGESWYYIVLGVKGMPLVFGDNFDIGMTVGAACFL